MKKFFSVFFSLILLVVIAAGVYLFAFDKEIPLSLVEDKINEIDPYALKIASFDDVNVMDNFSCNLNLEIRSESDNSRMSFDAKKSGKDDKFVLDLEATSYKYLQGKFYEDESSNGSYFIQNKKYMFRNKGDLVEQSEILWKGEILTSLYLCTPFTKDGLLHADLIKNNKDKVTQKGFFITLFASKDDISIELKVSIITTKRAYEELEKEGYIVTVAGKGSYVCGQSTERLKEAARFEMESKLEEIIIQAKNMGISLEECIEIFKSIYMEV